MKRIFALIAIALGFQGINAQAIIGGPWDYDNYSTNNQGTFSATMNMKNGLGLARWTESQRAFFTDATTNDQSVIYYGGIVYVGRVFASIDYQTDTVFGVTNGDSTTAVADSSSGNNIGICNTSWTCNFGDEKPVLRFSGSGEATFYGALDVSEIETTTIIVEGDTETEITIDSEGGEATEWREFGVNVPIRVFGAQISVIATFVDTAVTN
ncbi:MAG: hypothetical protein ACR2RV_05560 [Verrucomicrobiales bacterium]